MQENQENKPELRSEEVNDILGRVPGWITRNGIIVLLLVVALIILGSWVFRFPDVKKAAITVTSIQPPADIKARADGKIEELFVEDNAMVEEGTVLAMIENPSDFEDVLALSAIRIACCSAGGLVLIGVGNAGAAPCVRGSGPG